MCDDIYSRYRDFFKKENDLIKDRVTWLLTTQALLFATFEYIDNTREKLEKIVSIIGLVSTIGFLLCISAAIGAYLRLYRKIPTELIGDGYPETNRNIMIMLLGHTGPVLTALVLIWGWSYIIFN